jgi:hypothetical protein
LSSVREPALKIAVAYARIVTISTDDIAVNREFRAGVTGQLMCDAVPPGDARRRSGPN